MCRHAFILTINTLPVLNCPVNWYFFSIFQHFLWIVAKPDFDYFSHGHQFFCSFFMIGFLNACTSLVGWAASSSGSRIVVPKEKFIGWINANTNA